MREFLFRGKRIENSVWVEGGINTVDGLAYIACSVICGKNTDRPFNFLHEVDPATVSQYTGLNDKNGRKIFEGDMVKFHKCGGIIGKFGMTVTEFDEQKGCGAHSKPNYQDDGEPFSPDCYEVLT